MMANTLVAYLAGFATAVVVGGIISQRNREGRDE